MSIAIDPAKLITGPELLALLFTTDARPSERWLREQRTKRVIPYYKIGHNIYYDPEKVRAALERRNLVKSV